MTLGIAIFYFTKSAYFDNSFRDAMVTYELLILFVVIFPSVVVSICIAFATFLYHKAFFNRKLIALFLGISVCLFINSKFFEIEDRPYSKDGIHTEYYESGRKKAEGMIKDGYKDGVWITWNHEGQIVKKENYKDNMANGLFEYYYNGKKHGARIYEDGKIVKELTFTGDKIREVNYIDGTTKTYKDTTHKIRRRRIKNPLTEKLEKENEKFLAKKRRNIKIYNTFFKELKKTSKDETANSDKNLNNVPIGFSRKQSHVFNGLNDIFKDESRSDSSFYSFLQEFKQALNNRDSLKILSYFNDTIFATGYNCYERLILPNGLRACTKAGVWKYYVVSYRTIENISDLFFKHIRFGFKNIPIKPNESGLHNVEKKFGNYPFRDTS
ncbi:MAG: hypothetical protein JKY33_07830 [Bacteroidia bacterium]|nr:hypothetical protein [Bacteroidia bacterium]